MPVNKVIYNTTQGALTLIDLTDSTVTPETLAEGVIAYNAKGERIVGTMNVESAGSSKLRQFTFRGVTYQFEEGMTWGEWLESDYNTSILVVGEYDEGMGGYTIMPDYDFSLALRGTTQYYAVVTDVIVAGTTYETTSW